MAVAAVRPTLLTLPSEIRLRIYHHLFAYSSLTVCGSKFQGHHKNDLHDLGKTISYRRTKFQLTHVCRQLRFDTFPILMNVTLLFCCHLGWRIVDTQLPLVYRNHIRTVSIDYECFTAKFIDSARLSFLQKRCMALPSLPQIQSLKIRTGPCLQLKAGRSLNQLVFGTTQLQLEAAKILGGEATVLVRKHVLRGTIEYFHKLLANKDRGFRLYIETRLIDFTPKTLESDVRLSAHFTFDYDTSAPHDWNFGPAPSKASLSEYGVPFSTPWYRERKRWGWVGQVLMPVMLSILVYFILVLQRSYVD